MKSIQEQPDDEGDRIMKRKLRRIGAILLLLALGLSACAGGEESVQPEESKTESRPEESGGEESTLPDTPREGGELTMAVLNPDSFNPLLCSSEEGVWMLSLLFTPLIDVDEQGEPHSAIAKSWEWNGNVLTLKIDTDIRFHDGSTVAAGDVVYTVGVIQGGAASCYKACTAGIRQIRAVAEDTVVITFEAEGEGQLSQLYFPVLSRAYYSKNGSAAAPMGSGPYRLEKHLEYRELQLVRFEDYYGQRPYIDRITVYLTRVQESVDSSFESGKTDLYCPKTTLWGLYENREGLTLHAFGSREAVQLVFNMKSEYFAVQENRRGTALALDAAALLKGAFWNRGLLTESSLWPPEETAALGFDREAAGKLLTAQEPGTVLRLAVLQENDALENCARALAAQMQEAGLAVELTEESGSEALQSGRWDLLLAIRKTDGDSLTEQLAEGGAQNYGGYVSAEVSLLLSGKGQWQEEGRRQLAERLQEDLPVYTLFYPAQAVMTGRRIGGSLQPVWYNRCRGIENLYIRETET